jgi:hypothetical protein
VTRHLTRASLLLLLAAVWVLVRPLAAASPPDPTWIAGVYDDDDLDDAVLLVGSLVGVSDAPGPAHARADVRGGPIALASRSCPTSASRLTLLDRSPPQA